MRHTFHPFLRAMHGLALTCVLAAVACSDSLTAPPLEFGPQATVLPAPTVMVEVLNANDQVVTEFQIGSMARVRVTVVGSGPVPTGTVNLRLYANGLCAATPSLQQDVQLDANGRFDDLTLQAGEATIWGYAASYFGDDNYPGASSACAPFAFVDRLTPTIAFDIHDALHQVLPAVEPNTPIHPRLTVSGTGPTAPTGHVAVYLLRPGGCSPDLLNIVAVFSGDLDAAGVADWTDSASPAATGQYRLRIIYTGDDVYRAVDDCVSFDVKQTPAVETRAHDPAHQEVASVSPMTMIHGLALVTGSGPVPTGQLVFRRYLNGTCSGPDAGFLGPFTLDGSGAVDAGGGIAFPAGTQSLQAVYDGDAHYHAAVGSCAAFTWEPVAPKLTPTITATVHDMNDQALTALPAGASFYGKVVATGGGATPTGGTNLTFYATADCSNPNFFAASGFLDAAGVYDTKPTPLTREPGTYSFRASYTGDDEYETTQSGCVTFTIEPDAPPAHPVTLGSVGYWRNWRQKYTPSQLQLLLDVLKVSHAAVFDGDGVGGTADDLTSAKLDAIFAFAKKTPSQQLALAHFTALALDLALTQIGQPSGLTQPNSSVCAAAVVDVSGITGATALFGTSSPTVAQIMAFVAGHWTGSLAGPSAQWTFGLNQARLGRLVEVLAGINEGQILTDSGC